MLLTAAQTQAEDNQKVNSKIQKVVVFLRGGQVTRTASAAIKPGTTTLAFDHISPNMDPQSIQVQGTGDFTILSVQPAANAASEQTKQKQIDELVTQQKTIQDKITIQNDMLGVYDEEEKLLLKNQQVGGSAAGVDIVKLKLALDFQSARLTEIKKNELAIKRQLVALNTELSKINTQISETTNAGMVRSNSILVTVSSANGGNGQFTLSYIVRQAQWTPVYDIRAKDVKSPLTIVYKANVTQQSGEDWTDVKLTLSTANPNISANKPYMSPYYLDVPKPLAMYGNSAKSLSEVVVVGYGAADKKEDLSKALRGRVAGLEVSQQENQTNVEFNINTPFSIAADGKQYTVEMNKVEMPAKYEYYVAPKISTNVFLTARITDWNKYNFLPGEANLFFEGTYIGKSSRNSHSASDTVHLSLGVDKNIVVSRTLQQNLTSKQGLAANKKESRDWLIEIKNRKAQTINLLVEDQVPVSQNTDIVVETKELSGGKLDPLTGLVAWNFTLNPLDNKKAALAYQVRFKKDQLAIVQ